MHERLETSSTKTYYLESACLELTSHCNLRCTYCTVSQAGYRSMTMSGKLLRASLAGLRTMRADSVALNGHGETTILPNWPEVSNEIAGWGARVHLTSNFARAFTPGEANALSRLTSIVVSFDTDDAELLRRTRRSVDLDSILNNVFDVRYAAVLRRRAPPKFIVSCVVHSLNVMNLDRFVRFALRNGFDGFSFCNLSRPPELPGAINVDQVASLPHDRLLEARQKILHARAIALSRGASVEIQSGLLDSIEAALRGEAQGSEALVMNKIRRFRTLQTGETRHCLDPWRFVLIQADGSVRPCCWHPPVGSLEREPLEALVNGQSVVSLRRSLITGDLDDYCATCPTRPAIKREAFLKLLDKEVPQSALRGALGRSLVCAKQTIRRVVSGSRSDGKTAPNRSGVSLGMD